MIAIIPKIIAKKNIPKIPRTIPRIPNTSPICLFWYCPAYGGGYE
jgi:hypothetical protein